MTPEKSKIEWTDYSWNPWVGCTKISAGCKNCYMFRDAKRFGWDPTTIRRTGTAFYKPDHVKTPSIFFTCSLSDFFHNGVGKQTRRDAFDVMERNQQHSFLILTKRPENMRSMLPTWWDAQWHKRFPNVWFGVSIEKQKYIGRIDQMLEVPCAGNFVSAEPLLGTIFLQDFMVPPGSSEPGVNWLIVGGESGPAARTPSHIDVLDLRDQALAVGIPFFFKQWGGNKKAPDGSWGGHILEGKTWLQRPDLREPIKRAKPKRKYLHRSGS